MKIELSAVYHVASMNITMLVAVILLEYFAWTFIFALEKITSQNLWTL